MNDAGPAVSAVWPFDIGIVGTGIVGTHQLTREAEEVIRRCSIPSSSTRATASPSTLRRSVTR